MFTLSRQTKIGVVQVRSGAQMRSVALSQISLIGIILLKKTGIRYVSLASFLLGLEYQFSLKVISKYATRFVLGLSNSIPALEFKKENIHFIEDISTCLLPVENILLSSPLAADDWSPDQKNIPAHKLMTDGCGFLNRAALHAIMKVVGFGTVPAGVQGRIDGSKGFWILHPRDTALVPKIWIRNSQNKIQNPLLDRAHRIFDLVCVSHPSPPNALSRQSIVNLFANGIPESQLVRLMEIGLEAKISPLLQWDNVLFLEDAIRKCGNVPGARAQRVASSLNRVLGFTRRNWGDDDENSDDEDDENDSSVYTGRNEYSGGKF